MLRKYFMSRKGEIQQLAVIDDSLNTFLFKVDPLEHIKDAQTEMWMKKVINNLTVTLLNYQAGKYKVKLLQMINLASCLCHTIQPRSCEAAGETEAISFSFFFNQKKYLPVTSDFQLERKASFALASNSWHQCISPRQPVPS